MRQVAADAGVSTMTVSNALTGRRRVTEATRRRVLASVDRLGYQVNVAARSLRQGRTGVVGIAVPLLDSPYYSALCHRLSRALLEAGWASVVEETGATPEREADAFRGSRLNAYDGLVIAPVGLGERDLESLSGELPTVVLGEQELHGTVDRVSMDNVEGTAAATRLLLDRGCRRLAFVGSRLREQDGAHAQGDGVFALRARGFLRESRGRAQTVTVDRGETLVAGLRAVEDALGLLPGLDGVVCATDGIAYGVLRGLADHGRSVPGDVLVTGFDDLEDSRFRIPSLTSVDPGVDEIVRATVELLARRIAEPAAAPRDVMTRFRLVERESTTRPPARPPA